MWLYRIERSTLTMKDTACKETCTSGWPGSDWGTRHYMHYRNYQHISKLSSDYLSDWLLFWRWRQVNAPTHPSHAPTPATSPPHTHTRTEIPRQWDAFFFVLLRERNLHIQKKKRSLIQGHLATVKLFISGESPNNGRVKGRLIEGDQSCNPLLSPESSKHSYYFQGNKKKCFLDKFQNLNSTYDNSDWNMIFKHGICPFELEYEFFFGANQRT